jgi:ferredoxin-NADP reductase
MEEQLRCIVTEIISHGEQIYSLVLKPDRKAPKFLAGQYLKLALEKDGNGDFLPQSRSFSIASSPEKRNTLRITYVVKGEFTNRMETMLQPGSEVWITMPFGNFAVSTESDVCLLAGGTGITAFTAFIAGLKSGYPHQIYLFYGARRANLLAYRQQIEEAARICPGLHPSFLSEQAGEGPGTSQGLIDIGSVWKSIPEPLSIPYYLAGSPEMLDKLSDELRRRGIPPENINKDSW